ncbi:MAG: GlmU family protein [Flavobacteriales bacterium]|nr:GlmU family protein [Flavobacteriales bacterium]MEB2342986.1 GlmU family protein [Flavobacteriia bacterium]
MAILLSDAGLHRHLLPLTYTRPVGQLRPGILTLAEAWAKLSGLPVGFLTEPYLAGKFPAVEADRVFEVHGGLLPNPAIVAAVLDLEPGQVLVKVGKPLAFSLEGKARAADIDWVEPPDFLQRVELVPEAHVVERPWHLFRLCGKALLYDLGLLTEGRTGQPLSRTNTVLGDPKLIFLEEGAKVEASVLNTTHGPIWIGRDAEVMEGCLVRGPFALGEGAQLKMGAKIYGACSFGPQCRVGGEVNNCVIMGYSNKGHDGFLGNSVLGEWCNLGADTNTSNLKNTYGEVKAWSHADQAMVPTGQQFLGLVMGDHGKCGINTMFNTGTVAGVAANIFGSGFPPKHIPSFSWGSTGTHTLEKALETAQRMMERRHVHLTAEDRTILQHVFNLTEGYRN